jgi:hypothetical protein
MQILLGTNGQQIYTKMAILIKEELSKAFVISRTFI